jgi:hypothetical protein
MINSTRRPSGWSAGTKIFSCVENQNATIMKKLWIILIAIAAVACGDRSNSSAGREADENIDNYSTEDAAGQSEHDSAGMQEMDTVSSPSGIERQSQGDSVQ